MKPAWWSVKSPGVRAYKARRPRQEDIFPFVLTALATVTKSPLSLHKVSFNICSDKTYAYVHHILHQKNHENNCSTYLGRDVEEVVEDHFRGFCRSPALPSSTRSTQFTRIILKYTIKFRLPPAVTQTDSTCMPSNLILNKLKAAADGLSEALISRRTEEWRYFSTICNNSIRWRRVVRLTLCHFYCQGKGTCSSERIISSSQIRAGYGEKTTYYKTWVGHKVSGESALMLSR